MSETHFTQKNIFALRVHQESNEDFCISIEYTLVKGGENLYVHALMAFLEKTSCGNILDFHQILMKNAHFSKT